MGVKFLSQWNNRRLCCGSNSCLTSIHRLRIRRANHCITILLLINLFTSTQSPNWMNPSINKCTDKYSFDRLNQLSWVCKSMNSNQRISLTQVRLVCIWLLVTLYCGILCDLVDELVFYFSKTENILFSWFNWILKKWKHIQLQFYKSRT